MPEIPGRLRPPRLPVPPASPAGGEDYYDTATHSRWYWNDEEWVTQGQGPQGPPGPAGPPNGDIDPSELHIVSDEDPGLPDPEQVYISGDMQDADAWPFGVDTSGWCSEVNADGFGLRVWQCPDPDDPVEHNWGRIFSTAVFEALPGDTLTMYINAFWLADTPTMQASIVYGSDPDTPPEPGAATETVDLGTPVSIPDTSTSAAPAVLNFTWTVPQTITTVNEGTTVPAIARIGIRFTGVGETADMIFSVATLTRTSATWPLGTLWMNPTAGSALPTVGVTATSSTGGGGAVGQVTVWTPIPAGKKCLITSPPDTGGIVLMTSTFGVVGRPTNAQAIEFMHFVDGAETQIVRMNPTGTSADSFQFPVCVVGTAIIGPGQTSEIVLMYKFFNAPGATSQAIRGHTMQVVYIPTGVRAGDPSAPTPISYWDGNAWREGLVDPAVMDMSKDMATPEGIKIVSNTVCDKSAASLTAGQQVTLTATVSAGTGGTPTGTVTFYRSSSATGPWTSLGTATLASGTCTKKWTTTAGTWWFKATYAGSTVHATSNDVTDTSLVVTSELVTRTKTFSADWVMPYNGDGNQKGGGSYAGTAYCGYYDGQTGNQKTMIRFNTGALPGDADVTKVELTCDNWDYWRNPPGGLGAGWHENRGGSAPNSWVNTHGNQSQHEPGEGKFTVNLTGWADTKVNRSDFGGITIGPGTSNADKYNGHSAPGKDKWSLKVTYKTAT